MLIACNSIIATSTNEKRTVSWIKSLVEQEDYSSASSASFGEMLLLMAIHFHSQNLAQICELVNHTLGMKLNIRTSGMNRMKNIFTQEIFTEQVVASHAVKVPVTNNLSANITGFLPVHCIHQLLKSRTFSKHKVSIKDWIYRQICVSSTPLHSALPNLIEVFVNSILVPATSNRGGHVALDQTNEPISEQEVRAVFQKPVFESVAKSGGTPRRTPIRSRESTPFSRKSRTTSPVVAMDVDEERVFSIASQILMLYYILQYENVRLAHMRTILTTQRKVLRYSHELLANLPIRFLLQTAERDQERFGMIFPQLLKLCSTQFPHLCLVQDWLEDEAISKDYAIEAETKNVQSAEVKEAFATLSTCPSKLTLVCQKLLLLPPQEMWKFSDFCVSNLRQILEPGTPRQISGKILFFEKDFKDFY